MSDTKIEEVLLEVTNDWMALEGVNGVAQGKVNEVDCIEVLVSKKTLEMEDRIPREFKGFTVRVREVGDISIQEEQ